MTEEVKCLALVKVMKRSSAIVQREKRRHGRETKDTDGVSEMRWKGKGNSGKERKGKVSQESGRLKVGVK